MVKTHEALQAGAHYLKLAQDTLGEDQVMLAQAQYEHATKHALLRSDIAKLKTLLNAQEARVENHNKSVEQKAKNLVARENALDNKAAMLQQRLELAKREQIVAARERDAGRFT
jgi:uncharacterized protein (DUF3084 family)